MEAGHGMSLVTGLEKVEVLQESVEWDFGFETRRGLESPSCVFVGIVAVVGEESSSFGTVLESVATGGDPRSSILFLLRFRFILLDTVASCNSSIAALVVVVLAYGM
jgi:hypothetical protein